MPQVLKQSAPDETTLPGATRRRVWHAPDVRSHSLVVLTATRLFLTPQTGQPRPETLAALAAGADPDVVLGPLATVVEFAAVRRVRLDLLKNALVIDHTPAGRAVIGTVIAFATPEVADEVYTKVWRRLGSGVELVPYKPTVVTAAREPAAVMFGVLAATAVLAFLAVLTEDTSPGRPALIAGLNWRWVCAAGGVALAAAQVWLYRRLTRPPVRLELVRI